MPRLAARLGVIHGDVGVAHDLVRAGVLGQTEGDADAGRSEYFPGPDREGRAQRLLNPERDGVGLLLVAERVQENGELVSAQPGKDVSLPQARLEPSRHRGEQLVAHRVAEAVVDDLEAVEVEIERREPGAAGPLLDLVEPPPEPLHEDRAVAEPGQRVEESCAAEPILRDRSLRRVGQRSGDAGRAPTRASHRDTATQEPPVGAVLVAEPVLVLKEIRLAGEMRLERLLELHDVVSMDTVDPFLWPTDAPSLGTTDEGGHGQAKHGAPSP